MTAIPRVALCAATDCGFNADMQCHAVAIQVGDHHPQCDTYQREAPGAGTPVVSGAIGACKVSECAYNTQLLCSAPGIEVGMHDDHADCRTFRPR